MRLTWSPAACRGLRASTPGVQPRGGSDVAPGRWSSASRETFVSAFAAARISSVGVVYRANDRPLRSEGIAWKDPRRWRADRRGCGHADWRSAAAFRHGAWRRDHLARSRAAWRLPHSTSMLSLPRLPSKKPLRGSSIRAASSGRGLRRIRPSRTPPERSSDRGWRTGAVCRDASPTPSRSRKQTSSSSSVGLMELNSPQAGPVSPASRSFR